MALVFSLGVLAGPSPSAGQEASESRDASYEFLWRQAQLLFDYGKFDEATTELLAACSTPEGSRDAQCFRQLGTAAEKAGRIGEAIAAWSRAIELGGQEAASARAELQRLQGVFGRVEILLPRERSLPSLPGSFTFEGFVLDPAVKTQLAQTLAEVEQSGLPSEEVWLPAGSYVYEGLRFTVEAGSSVELHLPRRLTPYRARSFALKDGAGTAALGGPWELGLDGQLGLGGAPGGGLGTGLVAGGAQVRLGRHLGPLRLEGRFRVGAAPTQGVDPEATDRSGTALQLLGQIDLGVALAVSPSAWLTPHVGLVGGSLGSLLVQCVTVQVGTQTVWAGECRIASAVVGVQAGADLAWVLPGSKGRAVLRVGVFGEALPGGFPVAPGTKLLGSLDTELLQLDRWGFTWLRGGLEVGASLRF